MNKPKLSGKKMLSVKIYRNLRRNFYYGIYFNKFHAIATFSSISAISAASRVHPFCNLQSRAQTHSVLGIGLYELLDPTT
jgi:hypothetical protein